MIDNNIFECLEFFYKIREFLVDSVSLRNSMYEINLKANNYSH